MFGEFILFELCSTEIISELFLTTLINTADIMVFFYTQFSSTSNYFVLVLILILYRIKLILTMTSSSDETCLCQKFLSLKQ